MGRIVRKRGAVSLPLKSQRRCTICMETLKVGSECGQLSCSHNTFCYSCIRNWAEVTNTCPLCKLRFGIIIKCRCVEDDIIPGTEYELVEDKNMKLTQPNPSLADFFREIRCVVCGSDMDENIMLLCDECDKGFHTTCIGLDHIPNLEMWYCDQCILQQSPDAIANQHAEMLLASKQESHLRKRKRLYKGESRQRAETHRTAPAEFRGLPDFPPGFFDSSDPSFEEVASRLTAEDW